ASASSVDIGGYTDWRVPTVKELYSLILFTGIDPSGWNGSADDLVPFIDTDYFDFGYGDISAGERIIDAQFATTTLYMGTTMNGEESMFGVNFADGRIKGYPIGPMPGQNEDKQFYVYYVRGSDDYGINDFEDNQDETISDNATGLMWSQNDSAEGLNWEEALDWVEQKNSENHLGHNDWRLPNVKELQSIVDYSRALSVTNSAAIDPLFNCTEIIDEGGSANFPFYWSGTTHANWTDQPGSFASYVAFGEALGWMEEPPMSGNYTLMDVHGAGAQRSDPKSGDPADYPYGHGPQGDVIRIYNYVRLVRDFSSASDENILPETGGIELFQNSPNPFNPSTTISFSSDIQSEQKTELNIYDLKGNKIKSFPDFIVSQTLNYQIIWDGKDDSGKKVCSGIYLYQLKSGEFTEIRKMMMIK
ncbi:MAG: DUF1566 domain-containing protein, partial [Candidatus Cloacimonetes bacterium]|nr:DUF1566 domain-containing protein [Candidatus Cloacimonadota bacterium]